MSITRGQQNRIAEMAFNFGMAKMAGDHAAQDAEWIGLNRYLDSLVAEPAEQPKKSFEQLAHDAYRDAAFGTRRDQDEARLHADDARAVMQGLVAGHFAHYGHEGQFSWADFARDSREAADAMQAERKRRQG